MGWSTLDNGDLLTQAENAHFDIFITAMRPGEYQELSW
jgi:hypothetical protein